MLDFIDFILNVAGLLIWLNWRAVRLDPLRSAVPTTLAGTLRRAEPRSFKRWHFPAALGVLLFLRAIFYGQIGPSVNWSPRLDLFFISLPFPLAIHGRVFFLSALLFSILSFARVWIVFYFWLLALAVINRSASPNSIQKMISLQLGPVARWPAAVQTILPLLGVTVLWMILHPPLVYIGAVGRARSVAVLAEQGTVVGLSIYFSLKLLLPALLFLHLITCYVFLGKSPFWDFVGVTARRILAPLNRLPLRLGKMDFAPLVGIVLILLALQVLPDCCLRWLDQKNLTIWPQ